MQAMRKISAPVACTGQLRIERSLNSMMPVRQVQPNAVRIVPVCSEWCNQSSDHCAVTIRQRRRDQKLHRRVVDPSVDGEHRRKLIYNQIFKLAARDPAVVETSAA
jgi:hypothetical protein